MKTESSYNLKFLVKIRVVEKEESTVYFVPAKHNKRGKLKRPAYFSILYDFDTYPTFEAAVKHTWRAKEQYLAPDGKYYYNPYVVLEFVDKREYCQFFKTVEGAMLFVEEIKDKSKGLWIK